MIDGAGGFDLVGGGAVQQHRVTTVGAHDVIDQSPDIPFRARGQQFAGSKTEQRPPAATGSAIRRSAG